jgi:hypothetical protein
MYSKVKFAKLIFAIILALITCPLAAQIPFTTVIKEKSKYYIKADPNVDFGRDFLRKKRVYDTPDTSATTAISLDSLGPVFFGNNSLTGDIVGAEQTIMRLSTSIIYYKLYFYTNNLKNKKLFFPLFLLSRLSTRYDTTNVASSTDALDHDGGPISIRLMPSWKLKVGDENTLYYGFILDYRGLNVTQNSGQSAYKQGFYSAVGLTYGGKGSGQRIGGEINPGIWTLSLMLQCFYTDSDVIRELYKSKDSYVLAGQALFNFFAGKNNPLNIKAGAQYFFSDPLNAQKFSLKLGIGISN